MIRSCCACGLPAVRRRSLTRRMKRCGKAPCRRRSRQQREAAASAAWSSNSTAAVPTSRQRYRQPLRARLVRAGQSTRLVRWETPSDRVASREQAHGGAVRSHDHRKPVPAAGAHYGGNHPRWSVQRAAAAAQRRQPVHGLGARDRAAGSERGSLGGSCPVRREPAQRRRGGDRQPEAALDSLFPVIGGSQRSPDDHCIVQLQVEKGVAGLRDDALRIRVWTVPALDG